MSWMIDGLIALWIGFLARYWPQGFWTVVQTRSCTVRIKLIVWCPGESNFILVRQRRNDDHYRAGYWELPGRVLCGDERPDDVALACLKELISEGAREPDIDMHQLRPVLVGIDPVKLTARGPCLVFAYILTVTPAELLRLKGERAALSFGDRLAPGLLLPEDQDIVLDFRQGLDTAGYTDAQADDDADSGRSHGWRTDFVGDS